MLCLISLIDLLTNIQNNFYRPHYRPQTQAPSELSQTDESSDSDSETEHSPKKSDYAPYPFPPEATSICVDFEPDHYNEPPFTSEFNISEYFPTDAVSDFDLTIASSVEPSEDIDIWRTDDLGSSRISVLPEICSTLTPQCRPQCSDSDTSSGSGICVNTSNSNSCTINNSFQSTSSNSVVSTQCTSINESNQSSTKQQRQLINNSNVASILSKSLTSPSISKSSSCGTGTIRMVSSTTSSTSSGSAVANFGNGHQNGPVTHMHNSNSLPNSTHVVNNQSSLHPTQKHTPSNVLPGYNKFVNLARQQQQQ